MRKLYLFLLLMGFTFATDAAVYYVKPNAESTVWSDKDPQTVFTNIKEAYSKAVAGDEVWVATGTYTIQLSELDSSNVWMKLKTGVDLYGGFAGTETSIDGRQMADSGKPWDFANPTVVTVDAAATRSNIISQTVAFNTDTYIDGFIFEKSNGSAVTVRKGGVIQNCILRDNVSFIGGGGVQMWQGGLVQYCYFYNNSSDASDTNGGAGLYLNTNNTNLNYVDHCVFDSNKGLGWSSRGGGGLRANAGGVVTNCIFYNNVSGNETDGYGKGSAIFSRYPSNIFVNCVVYNNSGYPVYTDLGTTFINMTICHNLCDVKNKGYSIWFDATAGGTLANSVVWNNPKGNGKNAQIYAKSGSTNTYFDCVYTHSGTATIKTDQTDPDWTLFSTLYKMSTDNTGTEEGTDYANFVKPTSFAGAVALTETEKLAEIRNADWSITENSCLIDKGNKEYDALFEHDTDIRGYKRPMTEDDPIDLGAYEFDKSQSSIIEDIEAISNGCEIFSTPGMVNVICPNSYVAIYDIAGKVVKTFETVNSPVSVSLDKGLYIVKVAGKDGTISKKIRLR